MSVLRPSSILLLGAILLLGLAGCGTPTERSTAPQVPTRGYHPERFPDIPFPPQFALDPERDQLAMSVGGGLVRRFQVALLARAGGQADSPRDVLEWYDRMLPGLGWTPETSSARERERRFTRQRSPDIAERLVVASGVRNGVTALDLRLEPLAPTPTTP